MRHSRRDTPARRDRSDASAREVGSGRTRRHRLTECQVSFWQEYVVGVFAAGLTVPLVVLELCVPTTHVNEQGIRLRPRRRVSRSDVADVDVEPRGHVLRLQLRDGRVRLVGWIGPQHLPELRRLAGMDDDAVSG